MRLAWAWAVLWVLALSGVAHGQTAADDFGIERFRISTDPSGLLDVDSGGVEEHLEYSVGVAVGFAHDPLVIYDNTMAAVDRLVERRLSTDLVGSLGLWNRLQIGVGATIVGYQSGTSDLTLESLPKGGLGDFRFVPKVLLARQRNFSYAVVPTLTLPGGAAGGWLREAGATFAPAFAVSSGRDRLRGDMNLGYCLRPRTSVAGLVSDDEVFARLDAGYRIGDATEAMWSTSLAMPVVDVSKNQIALEMFAGVRHVLPAAVKPRSQLLVRVFAAAGIGLDNGYGTPDWRALAGVGIDKVNYEPPPPPLPRFIEEHPPVHVPYAVVAKATLTGTVTSTTGQPLANATVTIGTVTLTTDDSGRFTTEVDAGDLRVAATADGYDPGEAPITIAPSATGDVTVKLQRKVRQGQLRGQVLSFGGQPVLGATITVGDKSVRSDADGNYYIDLPAGNFEVTIEANGFATQKRKVGIKLDGVTVLNADLRGVK